MSIFESDENLEEILTKAKRIDKGIQHLEKKLSNVKNLGLSFAPEETKNTALNVLQEYEDEIQAMKENCDHCLEEEKQKLKDSLVSNEGIMNFIANMKHDLDKIEENLKSTGHYQPYEEPVGEKVSHHDSESPISESISHDNSDYVEDKSIDELVSHISSTGLTTPNDSIDQTKEINQKPANGKLFDIGSLCSESNGGFNHFNISASTCLSTPVPNTTRNVDKYSQRNDTSSACHTPLLRSTRKMNSYNDDACRTPVDPGISLASMKLLGKSNVKTKVYKTGVTINNRKNE